MDQRAAQLQEMLRQIVDAVGAAGRMDMLDAGNLATLADERRRRGQALLDIETVQRRKLECLKRPLPCPANDP